MLIPEGFQIEGSFPAVLTPSKSNFTYNELINALETHKVHFQKILLKFGALLFRDFPIENANQFTQFIESLDLGKFVNYIGGDSPRDKVKEKIYTSTEAPPNLHIPLHQELSFVKKFPKHIYFFCETAPFFRGETIIGDARKIYQSLPEDIKDKFEEQELSYISNYYNQSKIMDALNRIQRSHKSWREVFETTNENELEAKCRANEFKWEWTKHGWVKISQTRPATLKHPLTNEKVWFNQAHLYNFNPRLLGWKRYLGAKLFYFRKWTRLHEIEFADGSKISRNELYRIMDVLEKNTIAFPWKQNDVMVLDNVLAMHGRAPFKGKRRILTALTS